ncbi:DUF1902 domain-containing protein [Methylobacterium sp. J-068]|uniref:DUF1902 domain-containing protein n=1 Tax=Methylobacterium sp. J-068 TaxID=2836649 RepID=UPI001FBADD3B|nr:DUF1902 domain-containing protein [Methylobacterium sp. J-068]MCJ2035073.1 DUF1902 domain-containing protein [Methylobacterium sp. J-068]
MVQSAVIRCAWDPEAGVWFVQETDVPGLVTEAATLRALCAKLPGMIRDLVEDVDGSDRASHSEAF